MALHKAGEHSVAELGDLFGVTRSTVYRAIQRADRLAGCFPHTTCNESPSIRRAARPVPQRDDEVLGEGLHSRRERATDLRPRRPGARRGLPSLQRMVLMRSAVDRFDVNRFVDLPGCGRIGPR